MDMTLARGLIVAARSGMAVEQNHQSVGSPSLSGRMCILHLSLFSEEGRLLLAGLWGRWSVLIEVSVTSALLGGDSLSLPILRCFSICKGLVGCY